MGTTIAVLKFLLATVLLLLGVLALVVFLGALVREWRLERKHASCRRCSPELPPLEITE